jgi:hypothetical protein
MIQLDHTFIYSGGHKTNACRFEKSVRNSVKWTLKVVEQCRQAQRRIKRQDSL